MNSLRDELKRSEGFSNKLYRDTSEKIGFEGKKGKITIGWGYNIDDLGLPDDICEILLDRRIIVAIDDLTRNFPWTNSLDPVRFNVLADMVYNMGLPTFSTFKATLGAIQRGEYKIASEHMLDSLWAKQVGIRADRLAKRMETGKE
jgi:lysozyme